MKAKTQQQREEQLRKLIRAHYPVNYLVRTHVQHEALQELLRVALMAPEERLHMNVVVDHHAECGTARCLAGWCIIDDYMRNHTVFGEVLRDYSGLRLSNSANNIGSYSLAAAFGITPTQASDLFMMSYSANPSVFSIRRYAHAVSKRQVVERIRALLRGENIKPYKLKEPK